jgi:hypothetical protein
LYRQLAFGLVAVVAGWHEAAGDPAMASLPSHADPATACARGARLAGDPATVAGVAAILAERGIATELPAACTAVAVRLERDGEAMTVSIDGREPRAVTDAATAATVIESWVRTDVEAPLLAARTPSAQPAPAVAVVVPAPPSGHSVQWFTLGETAIASDRTSWLGVQMGVCVRLGPVCAAARLRIAGVAGGPGMWEHGLDRRGVELLVGGDIPLSLGRWIIAPGFGGGVGTVFTRLADTEGKMGMEIGGLRADAHVAFAYPVTKRLALELDLSAGLTQATHIESFSPMPLPDVPTALVRFGAGLRYGGL